MVTDPGCRRWSSRIWISKCFVYSRSALQFKQVAAKAPHEVSLSSGLRALSKTVVLKVHGRLSKKTGGNIGTSFTL